jgi:hypothetical protein
MREKAIIITCIFHYLSTRELRKMGTEIAVEMGKSLSVRNLEDCEEVKE